MAPPLLGNLGTKFSETSFPLPPARALRFLHSYRERETSWYEAVIIPSFKDLFLLKSAVHTFIHFLVACENRIKSQRGYFLKVLL